MNVAMAAIINKAPPMTAPKIYMRTSGVLVDGAVLVVIDESIVVVFASAMGVNVFSGTAAVMVSIGLGLDGEISDADVVGVVVTAVVVVIGIAAVVVVNTCVTAVIVDVVGAGVAAVTP
jgi:hypothetical protein